MQTINTKLEESRARLVQQGSQFAQQTTGAAGTFFGKTKKARERFTSETRKAGDVLATETLRAGKALASGVGAEATMWFGSIDLERRLPALPENVGAIKIPSARAVERDVLAFIERVLATAASRVGVRVKDLDVIVGLQLPAAATPSTKSKASSNGKASAPDAAPISGYDEMSAKDVVARLERLTDEKAASVLAYENANKRRATIVRAAEQRLAADA